MNFQYKSWYIWRKEERIRGEEEIDIIRTITGKKIEPASSSEVGEGEEVIRNNKKTWTVLTNNSEKKINLPLHWKKKF